MTISVRPELFQMKGLDQPVWRSDPFRWMERLVRHTCLPVFLSNAAMNSCFSLSLTTIIRSLTRVGEEAVPKSMMVGKFSSGVFQTLLPSRS